MSRNHAIARILTLAGISWFVLWACAPMMSAPPSPPMVASPHGEAGYGGNLGLGAEVPDAAERRAGEKPYFIGMGNAQGWYRHQVGPLKQNEAGLLGQVGVPSFVSGGGYYRFAMARNEKAYVGGQFTLGFLWVSVSLPMAFKVSEKVWLTTQPSLRGSMASQLMLPIGLAWELEDGSRIDAEIGAHKAGADNYTVVGEYIGYVGVGISQPFGAPHQ